MREIRCRYGARREFSRRLARDFRGTRIAWSGTRRLPGGAGGRRRVQRCARDFQELDCELAEAEPDLTGVDEIFQTLRAAGYAAAYREDYEQPRAYLMKDTVVWNIEQGLALAAAEIERAASLKQHCVRARPSSFRTVRLPRSAGFKCAISRRGRMGARDRRRADGDVHRLDGNVLRDQLHGIAGDLDSMRFHGGRVADRPANRRPPGARFCVLQLARAFELATAARAAPSPIAIARASNVAER